MNETALVTIDPETVAQRISDAIAGGLTEAARIYRDYVEQGGDVMALRASRPLGTVIWNALDDIACGRIDPRLPAMSATTQRALRVLPAKAQSDIITNGIEVLADDGSALRVSIDSVQARQAIGKDCVLSLAEQAAAKKAPAKAEQSKPVRLSDGYEFKDKKTIILHTPLGDVILTRHDLMNMIRDME